MRTKGKKPELVELAQRAEQKKQAAQAEVAVQQKLAFKFFVSYTFASISRGNGSGMVEITRDAPIQNFNDILGMAKLIEQSFEDTHNVAIINFILINVEPVSETVEG